MLARPHHSPSGQALADTTVSHAGVFIEANKQLPINLMHHIATSEQAFVKSWEMSCLCKL